MNKLPLFQMVIDESVTSDIGVSFVALVPKPAIEKNFMAFNDQQLKFTTDLERKIITGPAMVPDTPIYRSDSGGEYNVFFTKETIEQIALKFFKMDYQKNLNLFHDPKLSLEGVTIFESFVTDATRGIQPMKGFEDLPDGTWFISCKVENDIIWNKIKAGEVKGFSVEGIFSYVKKPKTIEEQISELLSRTYGSDGHLVQKDAMNSVIKDMVANFKKTFFDGVPAPVVLAPAAPVIPQALITEYTLKDGTAVTIDKLEVGGVALIAGVPAPVGDHELSDGTKFTVGEGGLITAVVPIVPMVQSDVPVVAKTPEQLIIAIKETVAKFAAGTPEERLANLETVAKALMDYSFGYDIRRAEEDVARAAAIAIYKQGLTTTDTAVQEVVAASKTFNAEFETAKSEVAELIKKFTESQAIIEAQKKQIAGLFELVEKIADLPTAEPIDDNRTSFSADKLNKKEGKIKSLADSLANLKKSKTA